MRRGGQRARSLTAKGLYLDLDSDGDRKLAALRESNNVPRPSAVIHTSTGKYQVIWRVQGFTIPEQEAMLKGLAETFGGDRACTDCARVFRLPGFFNRKYTPAFPVDFRNARHSIGLFAKRFQIGIANGYNGSTHHESPCKAGPNRRPNRRADWRWVMAQLRRRHSPHEVVRTLANIRYDKPNPLYYAHRTVDVASAVDLGSEWHRC